MQTSVHIVIGAVGAFALATLVTLWVMSPFKRDDGSAAERDIG